MTSVFFTKHKIKINDREEIKQAVFSTINHRYTLTIVIIDIGYICTHRQKKYLSNGTNLNVHTHFLVPSKYFADGNSPLNFLIKPTENFLEQKYF